MYILAIETTGAYASVALLQSGVPDAKAGGAPDAKSGGTSDAKAGGAPDAKAGGAPDAKAGGAPDAEAGGAPDRENLPAAAGTINAAAEGGCETFTTASDAAASSFGDARILSVIHGNDRFSHLQNLTPQIDQVLRDNELSIGDMTGIAVSHGPGSFTGIRIGVSTARALSQVTGIPCVPVSSLEALALRATEPGFCKEPEDSYSAGGNEADADTSKPAGRTLVCPILDARRKQVYGAAYELIDGEPVCRIGEASCLMTEFLEKLEGYLTGGGHAGDTECAEAAGNMGEAECAEAAGNMGDAECAEVAGNMGDAEYAETVAESGGIREILFIGDGIDTCGEIIEQWAAGPASGAEADQMVAPSAGVEADQAAGSMASAPTGGDTGEEKAAFRIPRIRYAAKERRYQDASTVALRGAQLFRKGAGCGYMELEPEYLRMAEAEKKLRDRQAAKAAAADAPAGGAKRPRSPERPGSAERPRSPERPASPDQPGSTNQPGSTDQPGSAERPASADLPTSIGQTAGAGSR